MPVPPYEYPLEQCDVPEVRRGALNEYRQFRRKCLEYLRGDADTSVMNQVYGLAWHTAVFRTLNEARRMEQDHPVNGPMWELLTTGYANIMTLGIRKLVDKHPDTDSVWNVIAQIERRPELLRRENFVCHDGLPFDSAAAFQRYIGSPGFVPEQARWVSTKGPGAWGMSDSCTNRSTPWPDIRKSGKGSIGYNPRSWPPSRRGFHIRASKPSAPWPTR